MNECVKQAKDFLESCNATMKITYTGIDANKDQRNPITKQNN